MPTITCSVLGLSARRCWIQSSLASAAKLFASGATTRCAGGRRHDFERILGLRRCAASTLLRTGTNRPKHKPLHSVVGWEWFTWLREGQERSSGFSKRFRYRFEILLKLLETAIP